MVKKRIQTFKVPMGGNVAALKGDDAPRFLDLRTWYQHGRLEEYRSRQGIILFRQSQSHNGPYGVVCGFKTSEPYRKGKMQVANVKPLTDGERERYRKGLRRRIKGEIDFWSSRPVTVQIIDNR